MHCAAHVNLALSHAGTLKSKTLDLTQTVNHPAILTLENTNFTQPMCTYLRKLVVTSVLIFATQPANASEPEAIRVTSFNIHYVATGQKKLNWDNRKNAVTESIRELESDIIAFQEMETFAGRSFNKENKQLDWVLQNFPEYSAGAHVDAAVYPNTQPIIYRKARFTQKSQGFFFFSETPDVIYSRTFYGSWPAFCSWSQLTDKATGVDFYVYNVHFEYKSMGNRGKSAALVKQRIAPVAEQHPVILLGDINAPSFSPTARKLKSIPLSLVKPAGATLHFNRGLYIIPAIDHIFVNEKFLYPSKVERLKKRYAKVWPTDHYPVTVELQLNTN